jgi:glycosyltransferase involved in cell wall biosynthesis
MTGTVAGTLVVVPAWNEEPSVGAVLRGLRDEGYDVVVVDDASTDDTAGEAERAGATVLRLPVHLGVGGGLRCGFRYAVDHGYRRVVQCDADGQHPPRHVAALLTEQDRSGAHIVLGSRFAAGDPAMAVGRLRRLVMRTLARSASRACRTTITDASSGFRCISEPLLGEFARSFPVHYLGDTYEALVVAGRGGYRVVEIPVDIVERTAGQSSAGFLSGVRLVARAVIATLARVEFSIRPLDDLEAEHATRGPGTA